MKKIIIGVVLALCSSPAYADVYVKVDAQGNAIGGAIMCDAATCGAGSEYSRLTLQEGERYVLQGVGVHHGIGNNNPNVDVKHEATSNEWVITRNEPQQPEPVVERFTVNTPQPAPTMPEPTVKVDSPTVVITETTTVVIETQTVTSNARVDSATVTSSIDFSSDTWFEQFIVWFNLYFAELLAKLEEG